MAGRGLPPLGRGRTGDLRVVVNVVIPRRLHAQAARPARAALRVADRGEPARERGHDREAQAGPGGVIRLGLRVRAQDAELARAQPILAAGCEEIALGDHVRVRGLRRRPAGASPRSRACVSVSRTPVEPGLGDGVARAPGAGHGRRGRRSARRGSPGEGLVVDPGNTFGLASHPTTQLCLELLHERRRTPLVDWGCGCGVLARGRVVAGLRAGHGDRARPGGGRDGAARTASTRTSATSRPTRRGRRRSSRTSPPRCSRPRRARVSRAPRPATLIASGVLAEHATADLAGLGAGRVRRAHSPRARRLGGAGAGARAVIRLAIRVPRDARRARARRS